MFKKVLAGLITAVLSLGVVALVAGPASAHHNTIWPEVACATDGSYKITWAVENSEYNKTEVIVDSSNPAVVPVNTSFGFHETMYFVQTVTEVKNYSLSLRGFWADGNVYNDSTGTLTKDRFPTGCITLTPDATPTPSVCDGPNHYTNPTYTLKDVGPGVKYTVDGGVKGPGTYPATNGTTVHIVATVTDPKYKIAGPGVWDLKFDAPSETCTVKVEPVAPDIKQQACDGPGKYKLAEYFIPDTTGVLYYSKINGVETLRTTGWYPVPDGVTDFQVIAKPDSAKYYVFKDGSSSKIYDLKVIPAGTCLYDVEPKTPKADDAVCTGPGTSTPTQLTLYPVSHVVYQVNVNGTTTAYPITVDTVIPLKQGDVVTVTATVDDPAKYQIKPGNWKYEHTFATPGDCKVKVTPVAPDPTNQYCDDSVTPRVLVDGTITIKPADNVEYYLDGVLKAPGTYKVAPGPHEVTIKFDTDKYYLDPASHIFPFPFTIKPGQCLPTHELLTPLTASTQIGCFTAGSYTLSNSIGDAAAVIWTVNGSQVAQGKYTVSGSGTVNITATPNAPDYGFNPGVQTSWTIDFQKPAVCDVEVLATTGQSPTGLLIAADMLVVAGLALFAMRAVRRGRTQNA
jgi:hypothetical protein